MASMNNKERARLYLQRLKQSSDKFAEAQSISDEINSLVWSSTQKKLTKQEKLQLIRELENLALHGGEQRDGMIIVEASDNSDILEVIKALKDNARD